MADTVEFAKMNGLGNKILVVDMRGRKDMVTPDAAIALNSDPATQFDQIMAIHDPRVGGTDAYIDILNCDGTKAQACGNGTRCVVQALSSETGRTSFTFQTVAGILNAVEHEGGMISVDMGQPRVPRYQPHRIADRADRRAYSAFAGRHVHGQSACDFLGGSRSDDV